MDHRSGGADPLDQVRSWLTTHGGAVAGGAAPVERGADTDPQRGGEPASRGWSGAGARAPREGRTADRRRNRDLEPPDGDGDVDADPESVARTIVLRKLAVQARTRHELAKALAARKVPEEVADTVLDRMEAVGLVDDGAFARDWVESRQQRRHLSRSALRRELQTKGVDREQIEEVVSGIDSGDEVEAARALATKKLRSMAGAEHDVQYRRLAGALARRGFSSGVVSAVLSQVLGSPRD